MSFSNIDEESEERTLRRMYENDERNDDYPEIVYEEDDCPDFDYEEDFVSGLFEAYSDDDIFAIMYKPDHISGLVVIPEREIDWEMCFGTE